MSKRTFSRPPMYILSDKFPFNPIKYSWYWNDLSGLQYSENIFIAQYFQSHKLIVYFTDKLERLPNISKRKGERLSHSIKKHEIKIALISAEYPELLI